METTIAAPTASVVTDPPTNEPVNCETGGPDANWNGNGLSGCAAAATSSGDAQKQYCDGNDKVDEYPYNFFSECCKWNSKKAACVTK